jgi:hypothetical protein
MTLFIRINVGFTLPDAVFHSLQVTLNLKTAENSQGVSRIAQESQAPVYISLLVLDGGDPDAVLSGEGGLQSCCEGSNPGCSLCAKPGQRPLCLTLQRKRNVRLSGPCTVAGAGEGMTHLTLSTGAVDGVVSFSGLHIDLIGRYALQYTAYTTVKHQYNDTSEVFALSPLLLSTRIAQQDCLRRKGLTAEIFTGFMVQCS